MSDRLYSLKTLAELIERPDLGLRLGPGEAAGLLARVEGLAAVLRVAAAAQERPRVHPTPDGLLAPEEAARLAGISREQFLRRAAFRPAIVRQGHRTLRVSERKLRRILETMGA